MVVTGRKKLGRVQHDVVLGEQSNRGAAPHLSPHASRTVGDIVLEQVAIHVDIAAGDHREVADVVAQGLGIKTTGGSTDTNIALSVDNIVALPNIGCSRRLGGVAL